VCVCVCVCRGGGAGVRYTCDNFAHIVYGQGVNIINTKAINR